MIIENESCINVISVILVRKLNLNIINHERPYRLKCLNEFEEVRVNKHVLVKSIKMRFCMMWFLCMLLVYC